MLRRSLLWLVNFQPVFMPALSPSMESGTVVEWKKKVGDLVNENDVFCTIQTDKAVVDYTNTFDAGYLAKIICQDGQSATVAKTIALLVDEAADVSKANEYKEDEASEEPVAATDVAGESPTAVPAHSSSGTLTELPDDVSCEPVFMPALSPSMESGTVVEWKKKVGDLVNENDVFCTIQTDKAVVDYTNTFDAGYLAKIICQDGQSATVAKAIALLVADAKDIEKVANYNLRDATETGAGASEATSAANPPPAEAPAASTRVKRYGNSLEEAIRASGPSVVRIAAGLERPVLESIAPSGKDGRFLKKDFVGQPGYDYEDMTPVRATRSESMTPAAPSAKSPTVSESVIIKGYPTVKRVDDSELLRRLLATMPIPKAKPSVK